jgi:hypothetical protein
MPERGFRAAATVDTVALTATGAGLGDSLEARAASAVRPARAVTRAKAAIRGRRLAIVLLDVFTGLF